MEEVPALREFLEKTTDLLAAAQDGDGYLNSWFQGVLPERRWRDLTWGHEMYCAGHLIQAGIAASRGAGEGRLLEVARRFADLLARRFGAQGEDGICGHPEIEMALVELYRETDELSYLDLATRLVELRGRGILQPDGMGRRYFVDHLPVREATEATGHAVRQLYLAAGITDVYLEGGDGSLLDALQKLWVSAFEEKTYVTGGQGSRHRDESFGDPFELPPDRAYAETCAAIASFLWCWRMLLATGHGRYADAMERALYNAIAVAVSVDGRHFFYSNPLQLRPGHDGSHEDAPSRRLEWYSCACCPPNVARLVASIQRYVATEDGDGVQLHLIAQGHVQTSNVELDVRTEYPWDGRARIEVARTEGEWTLSVRRPGWCAGGSASSGGEKTVADELGYFRLRRRWQPGDVVEVDLPMRTELVRAHPRVDAVRGCGALVRGPLVYCVERDDVDDLRIDASRLPEPAAGRLAPIVLEGEAGLASIPAEQPLYGAPSGGTATKTALVAIPYFRWANAAARAMRVWLPLA